MKVLLSYLVMASAIWWAHGAVNCTAAGRFADDTDTTCQNYTLCVYSSTSASYVAYNYTCPTTSVFNPSTSLCTDPDNYTCNNTNSTTSVCTADGYIADPASINCTQYIECVEINGTFTETVYDCPDGTYYNPNTTLCEADYNCTSTDTEFSCTAAGRFADTTDSTCQAYYLCVLLSNATFVQYDYTCPSTSLFNPNTSQCTASYTCTN